MAEQKVEWRPVKGYRHYAVSNTGLVMRYGHIKRNKEGIYYFKKEEILVPSRVSNGYRRVMLRDDDNNRNVGLIHRLVAEAFIPNPHNKPQVNHIDGDKANNNVSNLEWCTPHENNMHALENGLMKSGCNNYLSRFTPEQIQDIRQSYVKRKNGCSSIALAKKYGVSTSTILRIVTNQSYKYGTDGCNKVGGNENV